VFVFPRVSSFGIEVEDELRHQVVINSGGESNELAQEIMASSEMDSIHSKHIDQALEWKQNHRENGLQAS
jgi:hypothetical protein